MVKSPKSASLTKNQAVKPTKKPPQKSSSNFFTLMGVLVIVAMLMGFNLFSHDSESDSSSETIAIAPPDMSLSPMLSVPTVSATMAQTMPQRARYLVGIVAGHKGYDPGAVCDDGLTEASVNYNVATEVINLLARRGIQADLLDEFDDNLTDYQADALVSIHADSCNVAGATGFKVARVTDSAIPEAEDRLVGCLNQEYGRYTGLPQHPGSITDNMTNYHAFREIGRLTPGAIIEIGFLLDDRYLLEQKPKIVARGVAAGILCFLGE